MTYRQQAEDVAQGLTSVNSNDTRHIVAAILSLGDQQWTEIDPDALLAKLESAPSLTTRDKVFMTVAASVPSVVLLVGLALL